MDELLTDQQQAENVKNWLRQNGLFLVSGVVLGLGALFGWNQWQRYQEQQAENASALYESFQSAARLKQVEQAEAAMLKLVTEHAGSPYTDQGRLIMAKVYLEVSKPEEARKSLQMAADKAASTEVQYIARLRLARVLSFQQKYPEALKALEAPYSKAFAPLFHDVRGDVYYTMNKAAEARSEFEQALNADTSGTLLDREYVQAKLDDLGGSLATTKGSLPPKTALATKAP